MTTQWLEDRILETFMRGTSKLLSCATTTYLTFVPLILMWLQTEVSFITNKTQTAVINILNLFILIMN